MELKSKIENIIKAAAANPGTETRYREPLIGYASVDDPIFDEMKEIIGPCNLHPGEVLPEAKTVVSFFLPFEENLVKRNWKSLGPVKEWIQAKGETDRLITKINETLKAELAKEGISAVVPEVIFDYKNKGFDVSWSHRSAAYAAGLGTFGIHQMLITKAGCAGRFGSLVISAKIPPTPRPAEEFCRYKKVEKCLICVDRCPAGALTATGFDKEKCFKLLKENAKAFPELNQLACGKCATGPCALRSR
ncbi:epoxyqueuosine reductase [Methanosarcina sp.]|uniref:epoxyqueuosine reductase n=1 Tax=Methanosarcina sp. TaxID=2213 RepID=UPI003C78BA4C